MTSEAARRVEWRDILVATFYMHEGQSNEYRLAACAEEVARRMVDAIRAERERCAKMVEATTLVVRREIAAALREALREEPR